jgi:hypothetical protein
VGHVVIESVRAQRVDLASNEERWETVDLLARLEIGRFRSSMFYPFPGTGAFKLSVDGGFIDPEKVERLTDFTESSCLDFGAKENLFIDKLAVCLPWFVNARMAVARGVDEKTLPAVARYAPLMERVLAMGESEWEFFKPEVRGIDAEAAAAAAAAGEVHYAIKFNAFMGVRDDYYLAEERAELRVDDWVTAAALPK